MRELNTCDALSYQSYLIWYPYINQKTTVFNSGFLYYFLLFCISVLYFARINQLRAAIQTYPPIRYTTLYYLVVQWIGGKVRFSALHTSYQIKSSKMEYVFADSTFTYTTAQLVQNNKTVKGQTLVTQGRENYYLGLWRVYC